MKTIVRTFLTLLLLGGPMFAETQDPIATIQTTLGTFKVHLFADKVPQTAENFITLSQKKFYEGIIFHRVIKGFMSQTGDPTGTGSGGPGYAFPDEFHKDLRHNRAGLLSMANRGPNTGGSQFFITAGPTPHLDDRHAIFGEVIEGLDVCEKINQAKTGANDRPVEEIKILSIELSNVVPPLDEKKLVLDLEAQAQTLIDQNIQTMKTSKSVKRTLQSVKTKGKFFLVIWDVVLENKEAAVFWFKGEQSDSNLKIIEAHFHLKTI
jgi:peptidyl-prolyl cis-trans isomerase A (cyclophilin A)